MQGKILDEEKFSPVKIELIFESEQEICDLWLRLNLGYESINEANLGSPLPHKAKRGALTKFWQLLDSLCIEKNLLR